MPLGPEVFLKRLGPCGECPRVFGGASKTNLHVLGALLFLSVQAPTLNPKT